VANANQAIAGAVRARNNLALSSQNEGRRHENENLLGRLCRRNHDWHPRACQRSILPTTARLRPTTTGLRVWLPISIVERMPTGVDGSGRKLRTLQRPGWWWLEHLEWLPAGIYGAGRQLCAVSRTLALITAADPLGGSAHATTWPINKNGSPKSRVTPVSVSHERPGATGAGPDGQPMCQPLALRIVPLPAF
jgi:hypothetical protein